MLDVLLRIAVLLFMIGSLGGVGLRVALRDAVGPLRNARFLVLSVVANWVVSPVVALLVVRLIPLDEPYAFGLLLLSLAPCAPFAPAMVRIADGDSSYLASFMALSAVTTVAFMPLAVPAVTGAPVQVSAIARPLLAFILLPMLIGLALKQWQPMIANRLRPAVERLTSVAALLMLALIVLLYGPGVIDAIGSFAIAATVVFITAIAVLTHLMAAGLEMSQRSVVTIGTCTRNLGAALAPLAAIERDPRGVVMIAIGALVTLAVSYFVARYLSGGVARLRVHHA